jgi:hypothetical protein
VEFGFISFVFRLWEPLTSPLALLGGHFSASPYRLKTQIDMKMPPSAQSPQQAMAY